MNKNYCQIHKRFIPKSGCPICKEIADLKSQIEGKKILPVAVQHAIKYLGRNEKQMVINVWGAQAIVNSNHDLYVLIPEGRRNGVKPFMDMINKIGDDLESVNQMLAEHMIKQIGKAEYNDMLINCLKHLDIISGKIKKCDTCIDALDRKRVIRKEVFKEIGV